MKLKNKKGYSLIELIVAIPLLAIVFTTLGLTIAHQVRTYQELKLTSELQTELYNVIDLMRHGLPVEDVTEDEGLIGLSTAMNVKIGFDRKSIEIEPRITTLGMPYWVKFFLNSNGELMSSGQYGLKTYTNRKIFPSDNFGYDGNVGGDPRFKITSFTISNETPTLPKPMKVKIEIEAMVRFREKGRDQSRLEDIEENTHTIYYESIIFLANT